MSENTRFVQLVGGSALRLWPDLPRDVQEQLFEAVVGQDEALRHAKLNYLSGSDELTADPKTWAPLVAYGSLHQVFETDNRRPFIILVLAMTAIIVGMGVFYVRRRKR